MQTQERNALLDQVRATQAELERALAGFVPVVWIVTVEGLAISIDREPGKDDAEPRVVPLLCATRFDTYRQASTVAVRMRNGKGTRGKAIGLRQAIENALEESRALLVHFTPVEKGAE